MEVAVLGAGVGGVSVAIALAQRGWRVRIYERRSGPSTQGGGFVAWANATFVLDQLGVLAEVQSLAGRPAEMRRLSKSGEPLGAIDIRQIDSTLGYPSLALLRPDLQRVLLAKLATLGVEVHYGHNLVGIETTPADTAEAVFANGRCAAADVMIGADGRMASQARRYVHGDNKPVFQGFVNYVGVREPSQPAPDERVINDYWGVGERFGMVPVSEGRAYWAGAWACDAVQPTESKGRRGMLLARFADWPAPVRNAIEQTPASQIAEIFVHDHDPIRVWHRHNLIVIGDAAHAPSPTSGQGACQALEDAWLLAVRLSNDPTDINAVFSAFVGERFEKTARITNAGRQFAQSLFSRDAAYCRERDERSKATDFTAAAGGMAALWGDGLPLRGQR